MKRFDRKQRLELTLLFTAIVFCFFLITLVTVGLVIFVLVRLSLLTGIGRDAQVATHTLLQADLLSTFQLQISSR